MKKIFTLIFILILILVLSSCDTSKKGDEEFVKGVNSFESGNYIESISHFQTAIDFGTSQFTEDMAYSCMGHSYLNLKLYNEAIDAINNALNIAPDKVEYITNLAVAYRNKGDLDQAENLYLKALEIDSSYPKLNSSIGSLYIAMGQPEKAISYFKTAIQQDPNLDVAHGNIALAYAMTGQIDKAYDSLDKAKKLGYKNANGVQIIIEKYK